MFVYVRTKEIVIYPGYDAVVCFVQSDAAKLKPRIKYVQSKTNVAIYCTEGVFESPRTYSTYL
jgi:hypothetical protein